MSVLPGKLRKRSDVSQKLGAKVGCRTASNAKLSTSRILNGTYFERLLGNPNCMQRSDTPNFARLSAVSLRLRKIRGRQSRRRMALCQNYLFNLHRALQPN